MSRKHIIDFIDNYKRILDKVPNKKLKKF